MWRFDILYRGFFLKRIPKVAAAGDAQEISFLGIDPAWKSIGMEVVRYSWNDVSFSWIEGTLYIGKLDAWIKISQ